MARVTTFLSEDADLMDAARQKAVIVATAVAVEEPIMAAHLLSWEDLEDQACSAHPGLADIMDLMDMDPSVVVLDLTARLIDPCGEAVEKEVPAAAVAGLTRLAVRVSTSGSF
jgi:hypothetical protein